MQTSAFDVNSIINDLSLLDQAVSVSAANMKTNFDTQIAGISESFATTFQAIDMAALNSSILLSTNFLASLALINAGLTATQLLSDLSFSLMSVNALTLFTVASTGIVGTFAILNAAATVCCTGMEESFSASLLNIVAAFSVNFALINTLWAVESVLMLATTTINAATMAAVMLGAFTLITVGMTGAAVLINSMLDGIKVKFEETAQGAVQSFSDAQSSITESMNAIGTVSTANTDKATSGFDSFKGGLINAISVLSNIISIISELIDIITLLTAKQAASTAMTIANTAANTANSSSQLLVISTTTGVGVAATGAAAGMLAFGAAVLMICAGIALVIVALALLFSILGKSANVDTNQLNELKNPKVEPVSMNTVGYATGGYPSTGQYFLAREAGPELVGTIGSRSAVVNNDQIVASVSAGVYRAVRDAMAGQNGGPLQLIMDGTKVAEVVSRNVNAITQRSGCCPILV